MQSWVLLIPNCTRKRSLLIINFAKFFTVCYNKYEHVHVVYVTQMISNLRRSMNKGLSIRKVVSCFSIDTESVLLKKDQPQRQIPRKLSYLFVIILLLVRFLSTL